MMSPNQAEERGLGGCRGIMFGILFSVALVVVGWLVKLWFVGW
jgi:hypothetical protein